MGGCAKLVAAALSAVLVVGCAAQSGQQQSTEKYNTFAVVSITADQAHFGYRGALPWSSEWAYQSISGWGLDDAIEIRLRDALAAATGKSFVRANYDRSALLNAYQPPDLPGPKPATPPYVKPELGLVKAELTALAASARADALLLVVKDTCLPFFDSALNHREMYVNGFGVWARVDWKNEVDDQRRRYAYLCASVVVVDGATGTPVAQADVKGPNGIPAVRLDNDFKFRPKELSPAELDKLKSQFHDFVSPVELTAVRIVAGPRSR